MLLKPMEPDYGLMEHVMDTWIYGVISWLKRETLCWLYASLTCGDDVSFFGSNKAQPTIIHDKPPTTYSGIGGALQVHDSNFASCRHLIERCIDRLQN